eukprot:TRINITY_DN6192_c0_g1_i1.p1 TRINITY_DN6192_c0_g1~~TRINITY_DN6192_c0_g1_i1.p1  ORF type:complete len:1857 (-),score=268.81 TRINITY_DN6192_c0_g1_i1:395-5965(-)
MAEPPPGVEVWRRDVRMYGPDGWATAHYMVSLPEQPCKEGRWPVLFFLPGSGELSRDDWQGRFGLLHEMAWQSFVIVTPYVPERPSPVVVEESRHWGTQIIKYHEESLLHLLEHALQDLHVDANRICVTGLSLGAEATWNLAAQYGHLLAAAAPLACCGSDDVVYSEQGAWNLSHLPMRVYQTTTEQERYRSNAQAAWLARYCSWSKVLVHEDVINGLTVKTTRIAENSQLFEIHRWQPGQTVNRSDLKNHDVWSLVYAKEEDYGLFAWLLAARNPRGCQLKHTKFNFQVPHPVRCCPDLECPAQRLGLWISEGIVGAFSEYKRCSCMHELAIQKFRAGLCDHVPRAGDRIRFKGESWVVCRFGLCTEYTPKGQTCQHCTMLRSYGWHDQGGSVFYCSACWAQEDKHIQGQSDSLEALFLELASCKPFAAGPISREAWLANQSLLRCSCSQKIMTECSWLHKEITARGQMPRSVSDLQGHVLSWCHDGLRANGTIELLSTGQVRWKSGKGHGFWRLRSDGVEGMDLKFGPSPKCTMLHQMRFDPSVGCLILEEPQRNPPSTAVPVLACPLTPSQQKELEDISALNKHDPPMMLFKLADFHASLSQSNQELANWREQVKVYLKARPQQIAYLDEINVGLQFHKKSQMASRQKLLRFAQDFVLFLDKRRQMCVQIRDPKIHDVAGVPWRRALTQKVLEARLSQAAAKEALGSPCSLHVDSSTPSTFQPSVVSGCRDHCMATVDETQEVKSSIDQSGWAFFRLPGGHLYGNAASGICAGLSQGWLPAKIREALPIEPNRKGLLVEMYAISPYREQSSLNVQHLQKRSTWPAIDCTSTGWPLPDAASIALRLEGILEVSGHMEFRLSIAENARAMLSLDGQCSHFRKCTSWVTDRGAHHVKIEVFHLQNDFLLNRNSVLLEQREVGATCDGWRNVASGDWTHPSAWPLVVPDVKGPWHRYGRMLESAPPAQRVPPTLVIRKTEEVSPPRPDLSLLLVRWGDGIRCQASGAGDMTPTDEFVADFCDNHVFKALGPQPRYEVFTIFVKSSEDLLRVSDTWACTALQGQIKAAMILLWPSLAREPLPAGFVEEAPLFHLMARLERAGIPCHYPHSTELYRTLASKTWCAHLSLSPQFRIPRSCRISVGEVAAHAGEAARKAASALACHSSDHSGFVVKLGFSWNSSDVSVAADELELAAKLRQMVFCQSERCKHGDVIVQRRVQGVLCEPALFLVDGKLVETRFVTQVLGNRTFKTFSESEALDHLFSGNCSELEFVLSQTRQLSSLLLQWLVAISAETPSFIRMDFLVARAPSSGTLEVWTVEVCELGGGLCGLSGGRSVAFQSILRRILGSCKESRPTGGALALQGEAREKSRDVLFRAGDVVSVFHTASHKPLSEFRMKAYSACQSMGMSDGWIRATVLHDFRPSEYQEANEQTWVLVRYMETDWVDGFGKPAEAAGGNGVLRVRASEIQVEAPDPDLSFLVVRQGGPGAERISPALWFSNSSIAETFQVVNEHLGQQYEVLTAFVQTAADLTLISEAWACSSMRGKSQLGAYFLCPSLDMGLLPPSYMPQEPLSMLLARMESAGVQTWFPNNLCQYMTLTSKTWSAHLSIVPSLRLPPTTRVPRGLAAADPQQAAQVAEKALDAIRQCRGSLQSRDTAIKRGVVKLAPSWEGRGVWLFNSQAELAALLSKVFGGLHDHVLVQDFVEEVVVELRLHVVKGEVQHISYTRCQMKRENRLQSSFGGKQADGNWAAEGFCEASSCEIAEACFGGRHEVLEAAEQQCRLLVKEWWPFLLADCAESPTYVRFDFLVTAAGQATTGEITELGGQLCGWTEGRKIVVSSLLEDVLRVVKQRGAANCA